MSHTLKDNRNNMEINLGKYMRRVYKLGHGMFSTLTNK